jgi:VWFA-related protein
MTRILLAGLAVALCSTSAGFAQVNERVIHAGVVNGKGEPVTGLTVKDFIVREDGVAREILRVAKDEDPLQIALLVDNSVTMRNSVSDLRRALSAFVSTLRPAVQVSIITFGERPTVLVPYTSARADLQRGIDRLIAVDGGNYVLDAIAEASQGLAKRTLARSVIAIVTTRGPEMSYRAYTDVLRIVKESGSPALHAMLIANAEIDAAMFELQRSRPTDSLETYNGPGRDFVLGRLTNETGGRYEEVQSMSGLAFKLQQMAGELSNQYRVVFASPDRLIPATRTEISARDPKLTARGLLQAKEK